MCITFVFYLRISESLYNDTRPFRAMETNIAVAVEEYPCNVIVLDIDVTGTVKEECKGSAYINLTVLAE